MADYKISELPEQTSIEDDDLVVIADEATGSYTSKKSKMSSVKSYMGVPKVAVTMENDQDIDHATITRIDFDQEEYDVDNEWSTTNHEFTAANTGKYLVTASACIASVLSGDYMQIYIQTDTGGGYASLRSVRSTSALNGRIWSEITAVVSLNSSHKLRIAAIHNEGNQQSIDSDTTYTWCQITRLE